MTPEDLVEELGPVAASKIKLASGDRSEARTEDFKLRWIVTDEPALLGPPSDRSILEPVVELDDQVVDPLEYRGVRAPISSDYDPVLNDPTIPVESVKPWIPRRFIRKDRRNAVDYKRTPRRSS